MARRKRGSYGQGTIYQRKGWWWCDYSVVDGVRRRESCQTQDRDAAIAYLQRKQGKLASGDLLTPDRVRVRDLLALVLEDYDVRGVAQAYISSVKVKSILNPKLGDVKATKLTTTQVKQFIRERLKIVKPGTVNREMALLHRAYQLGFQHDPPLVARVPHFPKLPEGEPRKGFMKPELYRSLLLELPDELRLLFVIAYHVGLRRGALLRIRWSQVDLDAACIWMEGKRVNRKPEPVAVPIYGDMAKFLSIQPKDSDYVFARGSRPIKTFRESWNQACQRAGIPNLLFHDLRRTAIRNLRRAGVAETVIMKITGHRTRSVFERYNITDQSDTQQAGRMAEEFLAKEHQQQSAQRLSHEPERPN